MEIKIIFSSKNGLVLAELDFESQTYLKPILILKGPCLAGA